MMLLKKESRPVCPHRIASHRGGPPVSITCVCVCFVCVRVFRWVCGRFLCPARLSSVHAAGFFCHVVAPALVVLALEGGGG